MRVSYFSNSTLPSRQANSVHVVCMASAIAQLGYTVTLYAYKNQSEPEMSADEIATYFGVPGGFGIQYIKEPRLPGRSTIGALLLALKMRKESPDLILGRHAKACAFSALLGGKVVFETHQPVSWFPCIDRLCVKLALKLKAYTGLVTISQPLKTILTSSMTYASDKILVQHDGATVNKTAKREVLGETHRKQIGYLGHLYPGRGVDVIVALAKQLPEMDFHLVGGTIEDIEFWEAQLKGETNIKLHGYVPPAEAAGKRLGCDVLLAPYQEDTKIPGGRVTTQWMSPLKIFEYMSAGKPIIASDLPVLHEVLADGENCLFVPSNDPDAWCVALKKLKNDKELSERLGQKAYEDFRTKYTWEIRAENIVKYFLS